MAESEEELKSLLMKVKEESEKVSLKLNIQKTKIMASGPIQSHSWQIDGETMEKVADFILFGSKITADGECSHEIKRRLFLGKKVMTNLDSILKSRDITLPTKVHLVKAKAGQALGRLAQHRAASRPGLCAIAPGRRAGAPPVWNSLGPSQYSLASTRRQPASSLPRSGHWAPNLGPK